MMHILEHIRFRPEQKLFDEIFERYGLHDILSHYEEAGALEDHYDFVLGTQLRLTPILSPKLCSVLDEVRRALSFEQKIDLFVSPDAGVNAFAMYSIGEGRPHVLSLTSGLVERMTDDELRFVMGHEIGHLFYRHDRALQVIDALQPDPETGESPMPPMLAARLDTWNRLGELSSDRAGLAAIDGRLEPSVATFFKLSSGLGPEHLCFDVQAILSQFEDLKKAERKQFLSVFSHPVIPIRVKALQLYGQAGGRNASAERLAEVDAEVEAIARIMEFEVTKPLEVQARDFLLAGGLLAAQTDAEEINDEQWNLLLEWLLPLCSDPEAEVERVRTIPEARDLLVSSASWLHDNAGEERYALFRQLAHMVALDGLLSSGEQQFMQGVAEMLGIPSKVATDTVYEVLAGYLQSKTATRRRKLAAS